MAAELPAAVRGEVLGSPLPAFGTRPVRVGGRGPLGIGEEFLEFVEAFGLADVGDLGGEVESGPDEPFGLEVPVRAAVAM